MRPRAAQQKGRRRKLACPWHLLQVRPQTGSDEISVKSLLVTCLAIARFASKLIYCAVTVLRDRIRVPGEFRLVGVIGRASTIAPLAPGGTGDGSSMRVAAARDRMVGGSSSAVVRR